MSELIPSPIAQNERITHAIATSPKLGAKTKEQYTREITKALDNGVNLLDAAQVADYASSLSTSSRSFLRAALKTWTKRIRLEVNAGATPENINAVNATIARLDALDNAIELERSKGQKAHTWLANGEVRRLMTSVKGRTAKRDRVVLALLVAAGLRRDELVNLKWSNVMQQGDRVVLDVTGKGSKKRVIPISAALASILEDWRAFCEAGNDEHIIRGLTSGARLTDTLTSAQVFNIVRTHGARIGKPDLAPHDLRRSFAQIGYENGVPVTQLSRLLGHASIETTQR